MPNTVIGPSIDNELTPSILPIALGGTSATTIAGAIANFGAVSIEEKGTEDGPIPITNNIIPLAYIPSHLIELTLSISGPRTLIASATGSYKITNFSMSKVYTVSCLNGVISRNGDTISYTAPGSAGTGVFIVNNKRYSIQITGGGIVSPTITSPINDATNLNSTVSITSSAFATTGGPGDTHKDSSWDLATDPLFTTIISQLSHSVANKTTWSVSGLVPNTNYYVRVRHTGNTMGDSAWSIISTFKTRSSYLPVVNKAMLTNPVLPPLNPATLGDWFGWSVSISRDGRVIAIGAPYMGAFVVTTTTRKIAQAGKVYLYRKNGLGTWDLEQILTANIEVATPGIAVEWFGYKVSLNADGTTLAASAPGHKLPPGNLNNGAVYIFTATGTTPGAIWVKQSMISMPAPNTYDWFGRGIKLSNDGNTLIVGAQGHDTTVLDGGSTHIFTRAPGGSVWQAVVYIPTPNAAASDLFGWEVACNSDVTVIASSKRLANTAKGMDTGSVYIYAFNGTAVTLEAGPVFASDALVGDNFGYSLLFNEDGTELYVGAILAQKTNPGRTWTRGGAVYVFRRTVSGQTVTWPQVAKIMAPEVTNVSSNEHFGSSLAMTADSNSLFIGSQLHDDLVSGGKGRESGAVYVFTKIDSAWVYNTTLIPSQAVINSAVGTSIGVSANGETLIIGGPSQLYNAGAAMTPLNLYGHAWVYG
jgi:hypothetical protein